MPPKRNRRFALASDYTRRVALALAPRPERLNARGAEAVGDVSSEAQPAQAEGDVNLIVRVSLEMVRLYKEHFWPPETR